MPVINLEALKSILPADDFALVAGIVNTRTGALRASKPALPRKVAVPAKNPFYPGQKDYAYADEAGRHAGMTAYIWRMVAFMISPVGQHQCMPCTADFDLDGEYDERRDLAKRLDKLVDAVVDTVPKSQWHGVTRWGLAMGMIGTPQYAADGSVIYR
jgi:hypothetical protein